MPESLINSRLNSHDQILFINEEKIHGIQSVQLDWPTSLAPLHYMGIGSSKSPFAPTSEQIGTVNIDSLLVNKDYFLNYVTGNSLVNGYILKNQNNSTDNYSFLSGYFNNYQCQYSIGQGIPQITATVAVAGDLGKININSFNSQQINQLNNISSLNLNEEMLIPDMGSIQFNMEDFETNRLINYSISVTANKIPLYNMGSRYPKRVDLIYPIIVNCEFTLEIGNYEPDFMRKYPSASNKKIEELNVSVRDYQSNDLIHSYSFSNLILTKTLYQSLINGNTAVTLSFNGHINNN